MTKKNPNLTSEQKLVMFEDGTEAPGTSELNYEKREGTYHCANCGIKLFDSVSKYESGLGWPSFYESLPDVFETVIGIIIGVLLVNLGFYLLKRYINQKFSEKNVTIFKNFFEYTLIFLVVYFVLF